MDWRRALMTASAAAGAVALIYCILRDEAVAKELPADADTERREYRKNVSSRVDAMPKEEVLLVLNHWVASVEKMRDHMKTITRELLAKNLTFEQTCDRIKAVQPEDSLEKFRLSETEFDQVLNKHRDDPQVKEGLRKIAAIDPTNGATKDAPIPAKKVIEVHAFMLSELDSLVSAVAGQREQAPKDRYDSKTVSIAVQAIVGAHVERKFDVKAEDVERAVMSHHTDLAKNPEFLRISSMMQASMAKLLQK